MEKNYILFLDNISRTILATVVEDTEVSLVVTNPVVIQVVSDSQNKMKVQLIPILLRDLHKDPEENVQWTYSHTSITRASIAGLNDRFISQYEFVVGLTPEKAAKLSESRKGGETTAPVVKLFEKTEEAKNNGS